METTISISKEKCFALKNEIKQIAKELKSSKKSYRDLQSKINKENIPYDWIKPGEWQNLWNLEGQKSKLKFQSRHKLIAYSLAKGNEYGCVERKVREGNEPDWAYIRKLQDELAS